MNNNMLIIIPSAGIGKRMRSHGPKATIKLNEKETVISRQVNILKKIFPKSKIVVVVGFQKEKFENINNVYLVDNNDYENTNVSFSINLALQKFNCNSALIIYGDLVFTKEIFLNMPTNKSWICLDNQQNQRSNEVGINIVDNKAVYFSYGLQNKWSQIVFLKDFELKLFKIVASKNTSKRKFCFELLNEIIDMNGEFECYTNKKWKMVEIDTIKDISRAKKLARSSS